MNSPPPDFSWLVDAAGDDPHKLAQLALLLTTFTLVASEALTNADARREVYGVILAMQAIGKKIGHPALGSSQTFVDFLERMRREAT